MFLKKFIIGALLVYGSMSYLFASGLGEPTDKIGDLEWTRGEFSGHIKLV